MKKWLIIGSSLIVIVAAVLFLLPERKASIDTGIETLNSEFLTCLPKDLMPQQVEEVSGILERFREMSAKEKVDRSDQLLVKEDLVEYIRRGKITLSELNTFMAKVSYLTFKSNPDYNLPEGSVDHPLLVPEDN